MSDEFARKRPKLFSIWLWLNVAFCLTATPGYFLYPELLLDVYPDVPRTVMYLYGAMSVWCIYCFISMLQWKRRGFWGLIAIGFIGTVLNGYYFDFVTTALGLGSISITAAFLFLGGRNRIWETFV